MQAIETPEKQPRSRAAHDSIPRAAYSPAEFAAACGRHPTWTYRLLYSGKVHAITELGRILIPATELERVLSLAQPYDPKPKPAAEQDEAGQRS
jgi:hypothetical protein